jgi:hypothetical protein
MVGYIELKKKKNNTKDDIITATSKSGMHMRAGKKIKDDTVWTRFIRINDDITNLNVQRAGSIYEQKKMTQYRSRFIRINDDIYKIEMRRVEAGYLCPWHHYLFINLCEKYTF